MVSTYYFKSYYAQSETSRIDTLISWVLEDYHRYRRTNPIETTNLPTDDILEIHHSIRLNTGDNIIDPINPVGLLDLFNRFQLCYHISFCAQIEENKLNDLSKIQGPGEPLTSLLSSIPYSTPW